MSTRNAKLVLEYSSLYPFRTNWKCLICVYCYSEYEDPVEFRCHMDERHTSVDTRTAFLHVRGSNYLKVDSFNLKCKLCNVSFDSIEELIQHLHSIEYIEGIDLNYKVALQSYRLITNNWCCVLCETKLPTLNSLTRHMSAHYAEHACDTCGKAYGCKAALQFHVLTHSEKYLCKCRQSFSSLEEKKAHLKVSSKCWGVACVICNERFTSWDRKQQHMIDDHGYEQKSYPCSDCEMVFSMRTTFYHHYVVNHSEKAIICSYCGKKCSNRHNHEAHVATHTGEKKYKCKICSRAFSCKTRLSEHVWTHTTVRRFCCEICNETYRQKISLVRHMTTHHGD